ncbi:hypothetical protein JTB14_037028 [Gonioctena quinquepunctata]|nr:hypothetical protein JTB14_037028 [Gonioctena quinquepunctata]
MDRLINLGAGTENYISIKTPIETTIDVPNTENNHFEQPRRKKNQGRVGTADVANSIDTDACFEGSAKCYGRRVWVFLKKVKDNWEILNPQPESRLK